MNIINKPTASYEQCETWLKSKKFANPLALQNLPILWDAAVKNGVDPVVLIAQAMLETGYFGFGGVIDASFHNTCGLKATKGGGDYCANAHMRFKTWEDGIQAHSDHLALYAGSPNCPKYSPDCASHINKEYKSNGTTKDPRHFTYLYGKYPTVESLKGSWATDKQYDKKMLNMINEIKNTKAELKKDISIKPESKVITPNKGQGPLNNKAKWNSIVDGVKNATFNPISKKRK